MEEVIPALAVSTISPELESEPKVPWRHLLKSVSHEPEPEPPQDALALAQQLVRLLLGDRSQYPEGLYPNEQEKGWGAGNARVGMRHATEADHGRRKALRVPPNVDNVQIADDPEADLQATWVDKKGKTQYRYSAAHSELSAAEKFARLKDFTQALPSLRARMTRDLNDPDTSEVDRESAAVLKLIDKTGFRPGSDEDTGADKKAFGASTLEAKHVEVGEGYVRFKFTAKSGVEVDRTFRDPELVEIIAPRKARGGRLFPQTSDKKLRKYLKARAGDFKPKDFRTWHGTNAALKAIAKMPVPKTDAEFKLAQAEVAKVVAAHLGNTPAVARKDYINPAVWSKWKIKTKK